MSTFRRTFLATAMAGALLASASGCKKKNKNEPTPEEAAKIAELKPQAQKRLTDLAALGPLAKLRLSVSSDDPVKEKMPPGSWVVTGDEFLADPNTTGTELPLGDSTLSLCKYAVERTGAGDRQDVAYLESCARLEYVGVIRKASYTRPVVGDHSYEPGQFRGDVLVYHLASGKLHGAYAISAKNDERIKASKNESKTSIQTTAEKELAKNIREAASAKLAGR